MKYGNRVRHFPIKLTEDNRFYIGQHKFKNLIQIIQYYQKNSLFFNENGNPVSLGIPPYFSSCWHNFTLTVRACEVMV